MNETAADPEAPSESSSGAVISRLTGRQPLSLVEGLADLLVDTVRGGASVGFLAPLDRAAALAWWTERVETVRSGGQAVWVARDGDRVLGTVGLLFPDRPNSRHRAELVKLMVHRDGRGRGLGRALLSTAERAAAEAGVTLLHLDTETGSPAERLYDGTGWTRIGQIPDYAADPHGTLRPTSVYYKRVGADVAPGTAAP
ncbi:GNAT family N-acetyltransferase [Streptomyces stelliscabiei]|uniref:Ribosomal protein S18 acetylase RimI-like enzyme n=1 Tax=Streptomyces stelliscabiei TaxID=146820 RepID=A0A8I0TXV9_9ACTN|nr:GNAT family N-acetyltransferase [Streptomyces stelliscabiei]KND44590.1 acetyltransferase [Streptomyces stelliscabiei]MBE1601763.1 ribosomal protein S18 acetylase RimI-like enzyme [Streptomyces stelliscabiei]MDX2514929.1 GNAT family N-acetyltransferase [Streptomyces stelliscabiei]